MREVVRAMKDGSTRAKLAFDIFVHRLRASIGAMIATLGGLDVLVFTAGIGENSAAVRAAACASFAYLGLELDARLNRSEAGDHDVASAASRVRILVIGAQEDWAMAKEAWKIASRRK